MKVPRIGTWVSLDGLDHTMYQRDITETAKTGCGLFPFFDTDGHSLATFMVPTCVRCMVAPPPESASF